MSDGSSPASAMARSAASAPISRGAPRRLRVRGLADAGDRDRAADVVEFGRVAPVAHRGEKVLATCSTRDVRGRHARRRARSTAWRRSGARSCRRARPAGPCRLAAGSRPCRSRTRPPGAARTSPGRLRRVHEIATDRSLTLGTVVPNRSANAGVAASTVVSRSTIATGSSSETSSVATRPRAKSPWRSTRSARPRAAHAGPRGVPRSACAIAAPMRDATATTKSRSSNVYGRPGESREHQHRASDDAGADDRRAHRAVEAGLCETLVELGSDLRADFALRHLRNEDDFARVRGAARVHRLVERPEPQHRTDEHHALRVPMVERGKAQRPVGLAQADDRRVAERRAQRVRGTLIHGAGVDRRELDQLFEAARAAPAMGVRSTAASRVGRSRAPAPSRPAAPWKRVERGLADLVAARRPSPRPVRRSAPIGTRSGSAHPIGVPRSSDSRAVPSPAPTVSTRSPALTVPLSPRSSVRMVRSR